MRRIMAIVVCLMLLAAGALAESGLTMIVETEAGSMLITEDGRSLTELGQYDVIYCFTYSECPPERLLYAVTSYDASVTAGSDIIYESGDQWPDDAGDLEEGEEIVIDDDEWDDTVESGEIASEGSWEDYEEPEDWTGDYEEDEWYEFEGDYFDSLYAVMNSSGELITGFDYTSFVHDVDNAVIFACRADGFVEALDEQGNVLVTGEYAAMVSDGQGGYFATVPDLDLISADGELPAIAPLMHIASDGTAADTGIVTGTYELPAMSGGYVCVPVYSGDPSIDPEEGDDLSEGEYYELYNVEGYVFLDASGINAFGTMFDYATPFVGGYAEVQGEAGVSLIGIDGSVLTGSDFGGFDCGDGTGEEPIVANFAGGGFQLLDRNDLHVICTYSADEYGEEMFASNAGDGFIMAYSDTATYILDADGSVIYQASAEDDAYAYTWYTFCEGRPERIIVSKGSWPEAKCSLMDLGGNVIGGEYPELTAMTWAGGQGRYMVSSYDVIEEEYDGETMLSADFDTYRYGMIDQDGNTVLETEYTFITCMSANRFWVCDGINYQLVDENGGVIFETAAE